ncbi:MAG: metal-dependent transcriptional regulator [Anaerolineales bacterium]|nr:metal-dependent transcriptional regulator [Anaerolineales bacterium]
MATPAMQRYAAEIFRLQQDTPYVGLAELSESANSSQQATARMVGKMKDLEYLEHELYRGVRLTSKGEKIAMPALRRHRLVEVFLVKVMKYGWDEAHELSDTFALGVNDVVEDRIFEITGKPTRCPHGEPIPSKDGAMPVVKDVHLLDVPSGSDCIISRVRTHDMEKLRYFAELGFVPGAPFHLFSCAPFKGPLRLQMKPHDHLIGYELADALWVEVTKEGEGNKLPPKKI